MKQWSTLDQPPRAQFDFWREIISNSFVPLRPERTTDRALSAKAGDQAFAGSLTTWEIGDLFFGEVSGEGQRVYRGEREISARDRPVYFLNIQRQGYATVRQGNVESRLAPHSFTLVDASVPFEMQVSDNFEQLSIKIPKARLAHLLGDPVRYTASAIDCSKGFGRVLVKALETLVEQSEFLDPVGAELTIEQAMAMTAFALNQPRQQNPRPSRGFKLFDQAKLYLLAHLSDPDLDTPQLATHLGLSARYVQAIFAAQQSSVHHWILEQRLQQCRQDLLQTANPESRVATIAYRRGFNDLSYFNRSFKRRFGMTPSQCRRQ
jgi:AraC family transcriptional regulator, positive regulator of tynA and feaB